MDKPDEQALIDTLELAGVRIPKLRTISVLDFSSADKEENKKVHEATNLLILSLLSINELGECIHVTGEMRALTDPLHRQLCEEMQRRDMGNFQVLYNIPEEHRQNAAKIVRWNLSRWVTGKGRQWAEELRTIDVIANRSVDLLAYNTTNEIQYSVFGKKYILLQEKHRNKVLQKRVWLLKSEKLNELLVDRGRALIEKSGDIDEGLFREFTVNLSGAAARRMLVILIQNRNDNSNLLNDPFIRDFAADPQGALDALKVMDFVAEDDRERLSITPSGREFLSAF